MNKYLVRYFDIKKQITVDRVVAAPTKEEAFWMVHTPDRYAFNIAYEVTVMDDE